MDSILPLPVSIHLDTARLPLYLTYLVPAFLVTIVLYATHGPNLSAFPLVNPRKIYDIGDWWLRKEYAVNGGQVLAEGMRMASTNIRCGRPLSTG